MRRGLAALLVVGLGGTATELLLLHHYEDAWQMTPLLLIGVALAVLAWHGLTGTAATVRVLRATMAVLVLAALVGIVEHYLGSQNFQQEVDPSLAGWPLFLKVIQAKAPPALAPGVLAQLGLLGWIYTYRHPALAGRADERDDTTRRVR
jgi:hypothetical protein